MAQKVVNYTIPIQPKMIKTDKKYLVFAKNLNRNKGNKKSKSGVPSPNK